MKDYYIIDVSDNVQKAINEIALIDSVKGKTVTPDMVLKVAIDVFLRIRSLPLGKQELIAETIGYEFNERKFK